MCLSGSIRTDRQGRSTEGEVSWLQLFPGVVLRMGVEQS